jgi:ATP-dependent protease Clp, ATPase subunit
VNWLASVVDSMRQLFFPKLRRVYPGFCSFCGKHHKEVGPLAEGPEHVFICGACVKECGDLIAKHKGQDPLV